MISLFFPPCRASFRTTPINPVLFWNDFFDFLLEGPPPASQFYFPRLTGLSMNPACFFAVPIIMKLITCASCVCSASWRGVPLMQDLFILACFMQHGSRQRQTRDTSWSWEHRFLLHQSSVREPVVSVAGRGGFIVNYHTRQWRLSLDWLIDFTSFIVLALIHWLIDWLIDGLLDKLVDCCISGLIDWLIENCNRPLLFYITEAYFLTRFNAFLQTFRKRHHIPFLRQSGSSITGHLPYVQYYFSVYGAAPYLHSQHALPTSLHIVSLFLFSFLWFLLHTALVLQPKIAVRTIFLPLHASFYRTELHTELILFF